MAYAPDGKTFLAVGGGPDRTVIVWDAATHKVVRKIGAGAPAAVAYSPDGQVIAVSHPNGTGFWDLATGRAPKIPGIDAPDNGWKDGRGGAAAFSPDGKRLAVSDGRGTLVRGMLPGGGEVSLAGFPGAEGGGGGIGQLAAGLAWSPDGRRLAVIRHEKVDGKYPVAVWGAGSGAAMEQLTGHTDTVFGVAWSADGSLIATAGADGRVIVWEAAGGRFREHHHIELPLQAQPTAVAFSPDGKLLAVGTVVYLKQVRADRRSTAVVEVKVYDARTGKTLSTLGGLPGEPVSGLAFSPDGKTLIASTGSPYTGRPEGETKEQRSKLGGVWVWTIKPPAGKAEAPKPAFGGWPGDEPNDAVWDVRHGWTADDGKPVHSVAYSADGKLVAVGGKDGKVVVRDGANLKVVWEAAGKGAPAAVAFSPDGKHLATTHADGATVYDTATGKAAREVEEHGIKARAVAFTARPVADAPTLYTLALTSGQGLTATTWFDRPGTPASTAAFGPRGTAAKADDRPASVAASPDGKSVVFLPNLMIDPDWVKKGDGAHKPDPKKDTHYYAQVWGAGSGEAMRLLIHGTESLTAVAWSANGKVIATADATGEIVLWDGETFKELRRLKASTGVSALAVRADGGRVAAGVKQDRKDSKEKDSALRVEVWHAESGLRMSTLYGGHGETVRSLAFAPDGKALIAGVETAGGPAVGLRVWDRISATDPPKPAGRWKQRAVLTDVGDLVYSVAWSPDGRRFAAGGQSKVVAWDPATLRVLYTGDVVSPFVTGFNVLPAVTAVAYSPDGRTLAATSVMGVSFFDGPTGKPQGAKSPTNGGHAVAWAPDGRRIAVSDGARLQVADVPAGGGSVELMLAAGIAGRDRLPAAFAWSPDGKWVAVARHGKEGGKWPVVVWGAGTGEPMKLLAGHDSVVGAVAWSADGKRIVTAGRTDGTVIVWDAATAKELRRIRTSARPASDEVFGLALSPDGGTIAAGVSTPATRTHIVRLWEADTGKELQTLTGYPDEAVVSLAFSPDGKTLLTACGDYYRPLVPPDAADRVKRGEVRVWELGPGE